MSHFDPRLHVPNGHARGLTEEDAAREMIDTGRAPEDSRERCLILSRWPGILARNAVEHESRRHAFLDHRQETASPGRPQPRRTTGKMARIPDGREASESRFHQREAIARAHEIEHARALAEQARLEANEQRRQASRQEQTQEPEPEPAEELIRVEHVPGNLFARLLGRGR